MEQGPPGRPPGSQPEARDAGRGAARQHVRPEPLLPRRRDGADARPGARIRLQDPLLPPRRGGVQDRRSAGQGGDLGVGLGGLVGLQGRGDGWHPRECGLEPGGRWPTADPLGQPERHPTTESGSGQGDVLRAAVGDPGDARPGAAVDHGQPGVGAGTRLARRHPGAGQDGGRGRVVGRSVLSVREGRAGLQRRLARVRPQRPGPPAAHRFRAGPGPRTGERPMIALLLAQTIAITGGTVYPVSGPKLEHATVLMQNGRIAAVGTNVTIPAGATRIDATGKWVTPGLTDGGGQMGLVEIGAVGGTREAFYQGDSVAAAFNVAEGINPASTLIPVTRMEGVTTTLAAPDGHLISGQAVLIDLDGTTVEQMLVKSPVGIVANLSEGGKDEAGNTRAGVAQRLRQVFHDALVYERRKADFARAQMQALSARSADLEALLPVLHGQLPLIAVANRKSDIATALRLPRGFQPQPVPPGGPG